MALVFVRTGELIAARWDEFDLAAAEWRIPSERMKMRTPHIVPLSPQAIETLQALHTLTGEKPLLFPSERDKTKPMSNNTLLAARTRCGWGAVASRWGERWALPKRWRAFLIPFMRLLGLGAIALNEASPPIAKKRVRCH